MVEILDISVGLSDRLPTWPGGVGFHIEQTQNIEQDGVNVSKIESCVHVGTHVDAPSHFVAGGKTTEELSLQVLMGPVTVVSVPEASSIAADLLESLAVPPGTKRLLFKTKNSELWTQGLKEFKRDYVALTADAAQWVVDRDIRLVGVDYLSVQRFQDSPLTHEILLKAGVIIVEGLNLAKVEPGEYELVCLPLKIIGSEGAPARAVLVRDR